MKLMIEKSLRRLTLCGPEDAPLFVCKIALGACPVGPKEREGDGKTPEGVYHVCLVKERGKYGRSLGLDYPNPADGERGLKAGLIDRAALNAIQKAWDSGARPPWGTALGGEIFIHEGGTASDWTAGCIALDESAMDRLFPYRNALDSVWILP